MGQYSPCPDEEHRQESDPAGRHGEAVPSRPAGERLQLEEEDHDQPVEAEQDEAVARLVGLGLHERQAPPADVHELEHPAEGDPEEERPGDGEDSRAELVRPLLDEHAPDQLGRLGVQPVVVHELVRKRLRVALEVDLDHEHCRDDRDEDVQGEQRRLGRPVDRPVALPPADGYARDRLRALASSPLVAARDEGGGHGATLPTLRDRARAYRPAAPAGQKLVFADA